MRRGKGAGRQRGGRTRAGPGFWGSRRTGHARPATPQSPSSRPGTSCRRSPYSIPKLAGFSRFTRSQRCPPRAPPCCPGTHRPQPPLDLLQGRRPRFQLSLRPARRLEAQGLEGEQRGWALAQGGGAPGPRPARWGALRCYWGKVFPLPTLLSWSGASPHPTCPPRLPRAPVDSQERRARG